MNEKVYINRDDSATFVCPQCHRSKTVDVSHYMKVNRSVKVKCRCSCGHAYAVLLERRRHYRKPANLPGVYTHLVAGKQIDRGPMNVIDVSRSGLKLQPVSGTQRSFQVGEKLLVEFQLDDKTKSHLKKEVVVRTVTRQFIGTEFVADNYYENALGFYLLNAS
ncbi:MAG: PilZ domain-containing protein [Desulfobacterales bacterium]|jgi:hypothetical protein